MSSSDRISRIIYSIIVIGYSALIGIILIDITIWGRSDYLFRKDFPLNNIVVLVIVILMIALGYLIYRYAKFNISKYVIWIASALLLCAQLFIYYNILFITHTWDAGTIIMDVRNLQQGMTELVDIEYYSRFPNNVWIFGIINIIVRFANFIGITGLENQLFIIVIIQSILSTITGILVYKIVTTMTNSKGYGLMSWIIYVVLIGLSAQAVIPYTDMMSLIFPALAYRIYQSIEDGPKAYIKWGAVMLVSFVGYKIKPTVIIILMGIIIIEIIDRIINYKKQKLLDILKTLASIIAGLLIGLILSQGVKLTASLPVNNELNTGALHMLMMGTNDDTNGSFNIYDVKFACEERSKELRTQGQIDAIKERVSNRGIAGNVKFYLKKALMVFNDGTFAIGEEGGYYDEIFEDKIPSVSHALKSWYYKDGSLFNISSMIMQIIWIGVMLLNVLSFIGIRNVDKKKAVLAVSLTGIILFNLLFEARARYLLIYVPVFIVMAMNSLDNIYGLINKRIKRNYGGN